MKRIFTFLLVLTTAISFAQRAGEVALEKSVELNVAPKNEQVILPQCWSTLTQVAFYRWTDANNNPIGWILGNNSFGDAAVAQAFVNENTIQVKGAYFWIAQIGTGSQNIVFSINEFSNGAPGAVIASVTKPLNEVVAYMETGVTPANYVNAMYVEFDAPVEITSDFALVVDFSAVPYTAHGDGVVIVSNHLSQPCNAGQVFIKDSDGDWSVSTAVNAALTMVSGMFPVIEDNTVTVVDIIAGSDDHTTLAAAVVAAGLVDALSGAGPFTVFAPTNAAFDALPAGLLDELLADPSGDLTSILLYHVVAGKTMSTDLANGQVITTLLGQDITITINNDGVFINGDVEITVVDLEADNGVVHVIDAVLVPDLSLQTFSITFNVDMTDVDGFDYNTDKVFVTGTFAGWAEPGTAGSYELSLVPPAKNSPPFVLYENWDSYTDFTTDVSPWIVHHINTGATWGSQDFDFPGEATSFAWMVFNPSQTTPAIDGNHPPVDGDKYLIAVQSQTVNDNKWLVTPEVSFNATSVFSFSAKSITAQYGLERFRVLVSTTGSDPADFTVISPGDYVEAPIDWATFTYPLAAYAGQTGHIAIQYVSHDAFIFMLDALFLNATTDPDPEPDVLIYTVTVDNVEAGEVKYKYFSDAFGSGWAGGEWAGGADRIFQLNGDAVRDDVWGVNNTLSVPQVELAEEGIMLFPNPVRTQLNINSADMIQQVRIFDLTGRMVMSQQVNSNTASVNVSEFRQGVYVMQVMTANGIGSKKFTVVK
ncbi:MAG: fasciclin domain-containing protein [Bacteroidales bacterium]